MTVILQRREVADIDFVCDAKTRGTAAHVLAGEYDLPALTFRAPPRVLDIGANVGAFARWALIRWPGAEVDAYEPIAANLAMLRMNAERALPAKVRVHPFAVVPDESKIVRLFAKRHPCEIGSIAKDGESDDDATDVDAIDAGTLPDAHVVKIDIEGTEPEVLRRYFFARERLLCAAVLAEFHHRSDRVHLDALLVGLGFALVSCSMDVPDYGIVRYMHERTFKRPAPAPRST